MQVEKISLETKDYLVGKKIVDVGDHYIVLDNGLRIYLDDAEIEHINSLND
jgi:hypothetical protein